MAKKSIKDDIEKNLAYDEGTIFINTYKYSIIFIQLFRYSNSKEYKFIQYIIFL